MNYPVWNAHTLRANSFKPPFFKPLSSPVRQEQLLVFCRSENRSTKLINWPTVAQVASSSSVACTQVFLFLSFQTPVLL